MVDTIGRMPLGGKRKTGKARKDVLRKMRTRAEFSRDRSRMKLIEQRNRYKFRLVQNEKKMEAIKQGRERNLNPTAVETMPSYKYAKSLRNPANLSTLPIRPKYSNAQTTRLRIYGKRFDLIDKNRGLLIAEIGAKKKKEAAAKESESIKETKVAVRKPVGRVGKRLGVQI